MQTGRNRGLDKPEALSEHQARRREWDSIRGYHQGQRPYEPRRKAGHMTAPDRPCTNAHKNSCQTGASTYDNALWCKNLCDVSMGSGHPGMTAPYALELELVTLRHQVTVLRRQRPGQLRLFSTDRLLWVWLYRVWPQVLNAMVLVKPATVVQWHRKGFRTYWRWRSRRPGRPKMSTEIRDLIRQMSRANPLWGAPRIHGELLKLGIEVSQATVGRYLPWRPKVPSPTWRTFLQNHMTDIVAVDMFVVATATFRLFYALILLGHDRRRIIHFNVTQNPTQAWLSRQMTEAFPWDTAPRYLLRDRDAAFGQGFHDRVHAMGIEAVVTAPRCPWQNPYVERIIGSIRRECLDHIIIFNERQLRRVLSSYFQYHHQTRTHLSLD